MRKNYPDKRTKLELNRIGIAVDLALVNYNVDDRMAVPFIALPDRRESIKTLNRRRFYSHYSFSLSGCLYIIG